MDDNEADKFFLSFLDGIDLKDVVFLSYLRGDISEGFAARSLKIDRLSFREALSEWLKFLMDHKQVPVEGWKRISIVQEAEDGGI